MLLITPDTPETEFPSPDAATDEGLIAVGGELTTGRILSAYRNGIFPWFSDDQPVLWWSPEPRAVLFPDNIRISRSLRKTLKYKEFRVTADQEFEAVINACAEPRGQPPYGGTWITEDMKQAYIELHRLGYAHSIEVWRADKLVGGVYGISLGRAFFGESMFSRVSDASKVAMVRLAEFARLHYIDFIDCQLPTDHLTRMGAVDMTRAAYLELLKQSLQHKDRTDHWSLDVVQGHDIEHVAV
ncbi:MAG TPA: leucyl/phenylalanyl-tRNA--protein transferase [Gammaproteobacteria bacterium]|nr:leucyl/phenylalanyl-tRNA--protein transferase [Gammaproteobacteria bacterium]